MNPWLIAGICLVASGFVAWGSARIGLRWPLLVLSALLAAISVQLFLAAQGPDGFHDLAALVAQAFTMVPALAGLGCGLLLAGFQGHGMTWRGRGGIAMSLLLLLALAAIAATFLI